ncbi:hypothetical protein LTR28_008785 [Elasticomyces elasticus]|nr:hypothetical protein LTR28_008785 [Elasticomyces elasticus]
MPSLDNFGKLAALVMTVADTGDDTGAGADAVQPAITAPIEDRSRRCAQIVYGSEIVAATVAQRLVSDDDDNKLRRMVE